MKISRWISMPLYCALAFPLVQGLVSVIFGEPFGFREFLWWFLGGAFLGFTCQLWSDIRARSISKRKDSEIYEVRQKRNLTLLMNYEKAFELCKQAIESINPSKIKTESLADGIIEARTKWNWVTFGEIITIKVKKFGANLTEVEVLTRPIPRTAKVDYGEGWKITEDICKYLNEKDAEINKKVLVDSAAILDDVYVKPFRKEKVER